MREPRRHCANGESVRIGGGKRTPVGVTSPWSTKSQPVATKKREGMQIKKPLIRPDTPDQGAGPHKLGEDAKLKFTKQNSSHACQALLPVVRRPIAFTIRMPYRFKVLENGARRHHAVTSACRHARRRCIADAKGREPSYPPSQASSRSGNCFRRRWPE
jgi:hypothetical protein